MRHYQHGTDYVPETGPAIVHKGETILPAGASSRMSGGDTIIENVVINVQRLEDITSVEKFAAMMQASKASGTLNKRGKTKYNFRG
jgi:hypothetical protein